MYRMEKYIRIFIHLIRKSTISEIKYRIITRISFERRGCQRMGMQSTAKSTEFYLTVDFGVFAFEIVAFPCQVGRSIGVFWPATYCHTVYSRFAWLPLLLLPPLIGSALLNPYNFNFQIDTHTNQIEAKPKTERNERNLHKSIWSAAQRNTTQPNNIKSIASILANLVVSLDHFVNELTADTFKRVLKC